MTKIKIFPVAVMELKYDVYAASVNKAGEQHCGDLAKVGTHNGKLCVLLADGLGSGFTASLHASMTAKLIMSMLERGENVCQIINTIVGNMEKNRNRNADYCAFTLICAGHDGALSAVIFNMPEPVLLRHGKPAVININKKYVGSQIVKTLEYRLMPFDTVAVFSDGVTKAGIGGSLNLGFGQQSAVSYLQSAYKPHISSEKLVNLLLTVCNSLYLKKPGDDMSAIVIRAQREKS